MDLKIVFLLSCLAWMSSAWSIPFFPVPMARAPLRIARFVPPPPFHHRYHHHRMPNRPEPAEEWERPKRDQDYDHEYGQDHEYDHDHDHDHDDHSYGRHSGVTGPVHTFVKTDKNANYKWGVRHHVGNKYAS